MSLFRPQYTDKKTGLVKHAKKWWYEFSFAGRTIRESAKTTSKTIAKEAEKKRRRELEEGFNGIADAREQRILTVRQMAQDLLQDYKIRQPKSARFAEYAIGHVSRKLGELTAVDITIRPSFATKLSG